MCLWEGPSKTDSFKSLSLRNTSNRTVCCLLIFSLPLCPRIVRHGPPTRYVQLCLAHAPGMQGTFSPPPWVSDPDMHHGTCVTHVPWCMSGSLTRGFLWSWWRVKRSRHSWRMRNPRFYVSGKRPIVHRYDESLLPNKTASSMHCPKP